MPKSVFITGASRGLGKSLVDRFVAEGWSVFAGQRALASCGAPVHDAAPGVTWVGLDVRDEASVAAAARAVAERTRGLDVLVNNAAVNPEADGAALGELDFDAIRAAYEVNAIGPLRVTQAFVSLLERGERPLVCNVSSEAGSLQRSWRDRGFGYCMSKAALNMQTTMLNLALKPKGIHVIAVHPGWVRTDMGGPNAPLQPAESAAGVYRVITSADAESPRFVQHDGEPFPW